MTMPKRKRATDDKKRMAMAFNDAVRDILRADGVFKMGDDRSRDAIWEFDGLEWKRVELGHAHVEELALFDHADDEAVVSAG
jgi:hypothetical protein